MTVDKMTIEKNHGGKDSEKMIVHKMTVGNVNARHKMTIIQITL
jgi:hypothetical protein